MTQPPLLLEIDAGADADPEEVERLRVQLRQELAELDVEAVETVTGPATPEGAKALDLVAIGTLVVKLGPAALGAVTKAIEAWASRDARRSITVKMGDGEAITLTGVTDAERERLVDVWIARQLQRLGDD
jgi:hypothetical protein